MDLLALDLLHSWISWHSSSFSVAIQGTAAHNLNRDQIFIMIKYIVLLVVAVAVTEAFFVCPKHYCDNIECENLSACSESNGYKIKEKGSWCQCCDTCIKILGENERCMPVVFGMISKSECAEGLVCPVGEGRCVKEN
ncbi:uncharacterized protein CDAR_48001 [Caerostris darwini]|uniref:Uncharacterized protein n=1 Tax=Caerostris darwini TaxID=1538125 RepID=A0AAV4W1R0_9ARAC|nr:uncharacterized protein CDAR_48001 [Caerostris darwini]